MRAFCPKENKHKTRFPVKIPCKKNQSMELNITFFSFIFNLLHFYFVPLLPFNPIQQIPPYNSHVKS